MDPAPSHYTDRCRFGQFHKSRKSLLLGSFSSIPTYLMTSFDDVTVTDLSIFQPVHANPGSTRGTQPSQTLSPTLYCNSVQFPAETSLYDPKMTLKRL